MFKQWLQEPKLDGLLSDDIIMKQGEHIVDCERTLATLVQSSNVRLPGQRSCQYISLEALKDVQQLKTVLTARIHDFLHAIFLVPPESLSLFEWCSADYFLVSLTVKKLTKLKNQLILAINCGRRTRNG